MLRMSNARTDGTGLDPRKAETDPACLIDRSLTDLDCSESNVVDVQLLVNVVLGALVDSNGMPEAVDPDGDNIHENCDLCDEVANPEQIDSDGDGYGEACDAFPDNPSEWLDTDQDGVGDNSD